MGSGMAEFLERKVVSVNDWELYCHYVAGLVGYGLSSLFGASKLESPRYGSKELEPLSNSMGLFLQKTNIIRDYLEDINEIPPRVFWPQEIWKKYSTQLDGFKNFANRKKALFCLNELITDALKHTVDCLNFLKDLKEPSIFRFCAIPQVMAISTLELCYNNYDVFLYEVKIPKGEAVRLILACTNYKNVVECFQFYAKRLVLKLSDDDPNKILFKARMNHILDRCHDDLIN